MSLNPEYFMGYLPFLGPVVTHSDVASSRDAVSKGVTARIVPPVGASFRKRARKQTMRTRQASPSAAQLANQQAAQAQAHAERQAAEEAKAEADRALVRHTRQAAMRNRQETRAQLQQQQAEALEATRAIQKADAAAARRAVLEGKVQEEGKASLTGFVRVPKAAIHSLNKAPSSIGGEASTGGQANQVKGPTAPSTPPKQADRAVPSSPTSSGLVEAEGIKFCSCCFATSSPIWRRGSLDPFEGQTVCNACGMWEMHNHKSLVHSGKENKCLADFLAKQGKPPAEAVEMPNMLVKAQESMKAQAATPPQALGVGHHYGTRSNLSTAEATAAAGAASQVMQRDASSLAEEQPMQQVGGDTDRGLVPEATEAPRAACKRKGNSILQPLANKRSKVAAECSHGAVIPKEGARGLDDCALHNSSPSAADACGGYGSDNVALDGAPGTAQRRRTLRLRKGTSTDLC